jgi:hypothetical protein
LRRALEHGSSVLTSPRLSTAAKADFASYAAQLVGPPVIIGAVAGAVRRGRIGLAALVVGAYAGVAGAVGFDALRWETGPDGEQLEISDRARRAARLALFGGVWLGAVPAALWRLATRRGPVAYDKMEHE